MTRYFMKFTPLFAAEVQMMTPPRHQPRRSGRIRSSFRYSADDVRCKDCTRYDSGHPCHLNECICLKERIEAGVVELNALARECFGGRLFRPLQRRLRDELNRQPFRFFLSDAHRERWTHWKNRCYGMSERNAAALFLLTADEELWQRVLWHFDSSGFDFPAIRLSGIHPELYSIYQAAKTISVGGDNIVIEDLAFSELVSDRAFRLILGALLLCRYGWIEGIGDQRLVRVLKRLSISEKELLTKYCIEDKTQQEIAAEMGLSQRAVGKQLQQLKKYFKKF